MWSIPWAHSSMVGWVAGLGALGWVTMRYLAFGCAYPSRPDRAAVESGWVGCPFCFAYRHVLTGRVQEARVAPWHHAIKRVKV